MSLMDIGYFAAATLRAVAAPKAGPSLYDVCDPVLSKPGSGDAHRLLNETAADVIYLEVGDRTLWGVGIDANIVSASIKAVSSAVNRAR